MNGELSSAAQCPGSAEPSSDVTAGPAGLGASLSPAEDGPGPAPLPDLSRQVLLLRAGGERLGLVVEETAGVLERGRLSFVPKAPPGVLGIMNHVGSVLTVVSLAVLLGLPDASSDPASTPLVVVVERREDRIGLVVERIEGITLTIDLANDVRPEPGGAEPLPFSRGRLAYGGVSVRLLDGGAIVDEVLVRFERRERRA